MHMSTTAKQTTITLFQILRRKDDLYSISIKDMADTVSRSRVHNSKFGERVTQGKIYICVRNFADKGTEYASE